MIVAGKQIKYNSKEFKVLFDQMFPSTCVFAAMFLRDDAMVKDIAQEAFIKLWQKPNENFASANALKAYMYVLVKNACISHLRKEKSTIIDSLDNHYNLSCEKNFLDEVLREETYSLLRKTIEDLSPQTREVIQYSLNGLTNDEISIQLKVSINTVKTVKKRAYKSLREKLGAQFMLIVFTQLFNFFYLIT